MSIHWQSRSILFVFFLALLHVCAGQRMTDRLAISIEESDWGTTFYFRGKKQHEFASVREQLKKFAEIDKNLQISFIVHGDVTVQKVVELVYKVHAIGFTKIVIETCSVDNSNIDETRAFRKVQVLPVPLVHDRKDTSPDANENDDQLVVHPRYRALDE